MLGFHANAKTEDWLGAAHKRQEGAQKLAGSSSSQLSSKSQSPTFSWVLSGDHWVADLSKMSSSIFPSNSPAWPMRAVICICKDWKDFRFFLILLDPLRSTRLLTAQPPSGNISLLGKSNWLGLDQNSAEWSPGNLKCWCVVLNKLHEQASYCLFVAGQRSTATDFSIFASCRAFAIDLPPRVITKLENRMRHSVLALVLLLRKLEPAPQQPGC